MISLFEIQERKQILSFVAFFNRHLRLLFLSTSLFVWWELVKTCYRYYCPSLITVLQLSVLPRNLSAEPCQTITV
jgi:hypothetical protein